MNPIDRRERSIFLGALTLITLHVLDDNFLQPNPGTSPGDHLISGLVPLALLGLVAVAYPRVRAGARAAIAVPIGLFGIAAGLEGWHYTLTASPSGDDYTSLLALPAGLTLLCLAAVTLWKSRRPVGRPAWRYLRRVLIGAAAAFVVAMTIVPFLVSYGYTHLARGSVPDADLGTAYEEVRFSTSDGLQLEGWYIPSRNGAAVISFPGRAGTQKQARMLARHGYGVLLFDRRGEGESDGDPNSLGWGGYRDVEAAIEFLRDRQDVNPERIGGIGRSVGGEMLLEAAARSDGLSAVVSEGAGIRSIREGADSQLAEDPFWVASQFLQTAGVNLFANEATAPDLEELAARIAPTPVFLIYATHGGGGEELNRDFYNAAHEPKTLWGIGKGGHVGGIDVLSKEYERRVVGFFDSALLADDAFHGHRARNRASR